MQDFVFHLNNPWFFLRVGYLLTIAIETPVLCFGLSVQHPLQRRLLCGLWLTACTYPMVVVIIPYFIPMAEYYLLYLFVAEITAHGGECLLFYFAFRPLTHFWQDMGTIFGANLASFIGGLLALTLFRWAVQ